MEQRQIRVSDYAGAIDALQAAARYVVVLIGFTTALLTLFKARDVVGMAAYVQENIGQTVGAVMGLIAIGTALYGVFKTHKRGAQVATVAADPRVPDEVATLKQ